MDIRPVLYVIGLFLGVLALGMCIPIMADIAVDSPDWKVFALSIVITGFFSGACIMSHGREKVNLNIRQSFLLIVLGWTVIAIFGALPFRLSEMNMSYTDAFFESMSGITTTGATVITNLNEAPPGILLWRAMLQWLGGVGIILLAMSILPSLNVGGMQVFQAELSENEKATPRVSQLASSTGLIYMGLTVLCIMSYVFVGMDGFNALAHAMTTIATGGYSTYDSSFMHYDSYGPEIVGIIFMIAGGIPFALYFKAVYGNLGVFLKDVQVRGFLTVISLITLILSVHLILSQSFSPDKALVKSLFNVVSVITGTGYASHDYGAWGGLAVGVFFFLMVVGGCAGSTSCGIKIFRFQILIAVIKAQIQKLLYPNAVFVPHYKNKPLTIDTTLAVMSFFFVYALTFVVLACALSFTGLDFMTALSGAVTAVSNVGPGLGEIIGPAGTFAPLNNAAKWLLSVGMLLGRLEIFTVLVLLTPHFWRQ